MRLLAPACSVPQHTEVCTAVKLTLHHLGCWKSAARFLAWGMRGSAKLLGRYFSFFLISWVVLGFFSLSIFASKKGLGVMGVGWIAPALLYEGKGSIRRKDVGCLLAACMTPEIPKQYAGDQQYNDCVVLTSA